MASKKKAVGLRVTDEMYEKIEALAKVKRWSVAATVEWLLEQTLTKGVKSKGSTDEHEGSNGK